jgi:TIR domain
MPIADQQDSKSTAMTVDEPQWLSRPSIKLFISYAHPDEDLRLELDDHLSNLQRQRIITGWHDRRIEPGQEWADQIDNALNEAQIILLLISARFMASDYCYAKEMARAIERHEAGEAVVIPVILGACDWQDAPFSKLQALPKDAKPIKNWNDRDEAWLDVVRGLRRVIDRLSGPVPTVETSSAGGGPPAKTVPPDKRQTPGPAAELHFQGGATKAWQEAQKNIIELIAEAQITENLDKLGMKLAGDMLLAGGALPSASRDQVQRQLEDEKRRHGQSGAPRAQADYLDDVMHRINFGRLQDFLSYGEERYTQDGFAALCVVQQSELMGGRWGLKRIQSWLESGGKQPKEIHIQPIQNEALDAPMISRRLAAAFAIVPEESLNGISAITQRICGAFHQDRRILITIQPCDEFSDETWWWVLHEFWRAFIQAFRQSPTRRRVRFLLILLTDLPLASADVVAHCCDTDVVSFKQEKLVRLPLDYWTEPELLDWLSDYWGDNRTDQQLEALAKKFFLASQGQPSVIYNLCKNHLLKEVN